MKPKPCKHLDYETGFVDCALCNVPGDPSIRYWHRLNPPYEGAPVKVQFCGKGHGRINDILSCYLGERSCYEPE